MSSSLQVELTAAAADADKDRLLYTWSVTGGGFTGSGNRVTWDLAGASPGDYVATVEVTDGHGHTKHESTLVTVAQCANCGPPPCPAVSVMCPTEVNEGDLLAFSSSVSSDASLTYNWSTSDGMIISGQGTPTITVDTAGLGNQTVTATLELAGLDSYCGRTASCSTSIRAPARMIGVSFDQYWNISFNDEKARLDRFAMALQQEPGSRGAIIAYGSYEGEARKRLTRARNYLVGTRGIDSARVVLIDGGCRDEQATELWVVPSGGAMPGPSSQGAVDPCPLITTSAGTPSAATAAPAKLRGVVRGQNGEPIAGARVLAYANDGSVKETKTDQNGSFVFDDLEPGTYRLEISAQGFGDLTVMSVVVNEGENLLPPFVMGSEKRTITLKERDIIRVEYPETFWKNTPGDVAFVFDRRLSETEVETSQTKVDGRIHIQEKPPPVPGATPDQPYYIAHGEGYSAYATVTLIPSGSTIMEGPARTEQPLKEAPVTWKWKLKPAVDAQEVSFRFHVDLVWRAPGLQDKYSYDWERTFSVPIVDPPLKVVAATWGYKGFGGGGMGMLAMGTVRRRRRNGDPAEGTPAPAVPEEILDEVNTSVYAPRQAVPGDSFLVQVFAHLPEADPNVLRSDALAADPGAQALGAQPLEQEITRGSTLSFTLIMDGLTIDKSTQTRVWKGRTTRVQFGVTVPQTAEPRSMFGTVVICENGEPVGDFRFAFKILASAAATPAAPVVLEPATRYQNSFISYAHEDQAEVLRRVQMLSIMRQNYFLDLVTLKSGDQWENKIYEHIDKSDCFILFWSSAAQGSEWVKKEIARALARQAGDRNAPPKIYAVPIEGPPAPQPPDELKYLQFGDELNYLIFAAERTPQP